MYSTLSDTRGASRHGILRARDACTRSVLHVYMQITRLHADAIIEKVEEPVRKHTVRVPSSSISYVSEFIKRKMDAANLEANQ